MDFETKCLHVALDAAKKAEKVVLQYYEHPTLAIETKHDNTPVTIADRESERIIKETIHAAFPDHGFLGEEEGEHNQEAQYTWIIDPIDGTKNFTRGIPIFGILIALMKDEEIILGVSLAPALHECLYAQKGKGAFLNGKKVQVSTIANLTSATLCHGGAKHFLNTGILENLNNIIAHTNRDRAFGDIYNYHLLAQGKVDIVVEPEFKIWDVAPFVCIIQEAGGKVTDIKGNPITRKTTSAIATNAVLQNEVQKFFQ
ncbi:inositol-phosphate phosphatase [Candidatus Woesearchaeota archaeon]|nr:inositol-phosphate phosphatase [Candidatus Woesearchaeota archaeon]